MLRCVLPVVLALALAALATTQVHAAAKGKDGHDHIGHADAGPMLSDPTEFKWDLALWSAVVFVLLVLVLWKFAWGPICEALDRRETHISDQIAGVERANEEAKRNLADYEKKLAEASNEVREMIEEARRDADHTRQEIVADAKREAEAERDRALRDIETAKGSALKELAENSANLAVDLAGKIIEEKLKPEDHSALIRKAVDGFPAGSPSEN
ncbi:MAG: F0F1 ATP synthase subunit B [Pirellulales bacterium]|nr:F0F1 ATP synthase subunit B [Pirellulales bacterium]